MNAKFFWEVINMKEYSRVNSEILNKAPKLPGATNN